MAHQTSILTSVDPSFAPSLSASLSNSTEGLRLLPGVSVREAVGERERWESVTDRVEETLGKPPRTLPSSPPLLRDPKSMAELWRTIGSLCR